MTVSNYFLTKIKKVLQISIFKVNFVDFYIQTFPCMNYKIIRENYLKVYFIFFWSYILVKFQKNHAKFDRVFLFSFQLRSAIQSDNKNVVDNTACVFCTQRPCMGWLATNLPCHDPCLYGHHGEVLPGHICRGKTKYRIQRQYE